MTIQQAFELALQHHQAGRLPEAEVIYRQILALEPQHADALHLLGVLAHHVGQNDLAADLICQAIALTPSSAVFHSNLGEVRRALGLVDEAIAAYRQAIALEDSNPAAHNNLGIALKTTGQLDEAITAYRQAIGLKADYPEAHNNLGIALQDRGQLAEAIAAFRQAINLKPNYPEAYSNLANALKDKGQLDEAIAAYRQAITFKPNFAEAHYNLGIALKAAGQLDDAIAAYRQAIEFKANYPEAHSNLGIALQDRDQLDEAIASYRQAIALRFNYPEAHQNLGTALCDEGHLDEAIAAYRQAIALKPDYPASHRDLGTTLRDSGRLDEAIESYRTAIALDPAYAEAHSNLLLGLNCHPSFDARTVAEEHRRWSQQHAEPLRRFIDSHCNDPAPERRMRIGYISRDFRAHPVAFFLENALANHDRAEVEVFCYADVSKPDATTTRLRHQADHWCSITNMTDAQVAGLIRKHGVDVLVDLAGHTTKNRLLVFARQPAPVQVTLLGYPNTTGLDTIDYRLTDAIADPPGMTEHLHTEQLVRLPACAWCFRPSEASPPESGTPALHNGCITFGCFNAMPKLNQPLLKLWSEILLAVPGSRLLLKNAALRESSVQERVLAVFEESGVASERIVLAGYAATLRAHLESYGQLDIALDTFPYHGTTTTCEALWMGVPLVTLAGATHVSRVGLSLLTNIGLKELAAASPEQYIQIAVNLAHDVPHLAALRATLRARMRHSPLMDAPRFARSIEAAYRDMWRRWCMKP